MGKKKPKKEGTVSVEFAVSSFRYKGVEYKSADVEKAAEDGDEDALAIVANLVRMNSGVLKQADEKGGSDDE